MKSRQTNEKEPDPSEIEKLYHKKEIYKNKSKYDENSKILLWPQVLAAFSAAMVHLALGAIYGYTGAMLPQFTADNNSTDIIFNVKQVAIFSSIPQIASVAIGIAVGFMATYLGQRISLLILIPVGFAGWIILSLSSAFYLLAFSRFIQGLFTGIAVIVSNSYLIEMAHKSLRGRLCALTDIFRQIGLTFVALISLTNMSWRSIAVTMAFTNLLPPFFIFLYLPDSPRWLASRGKYLDARKSLSFFRGSSYDISDEIDDVIKQIENSPKAKRVIDQVLLIIKSRSIYKLFIPLTFINLCMHLTGNVTMITYSATIFKAAGSTIEPIICTVISSSMKILGTILYFLLSDKCRRRILSTVTTSLAGICLIFLGLVDYLKNTSEIPGWLPLLCVSVFNITSSMSLPILLLWRNELIPNSVRPIGISFLSTASHVTMFISSYGFPYMIISLGFPVTFWIYSFFNFFIVAIILIFLPETVGKTLEEIHE